MRELSCNELKSALDKYTNGRYGKIDKAFFQQIGQGIKKRGFLTATDLFCVICWKQWSYEEALDNAFGSIIENSEDKIKQTTGKAIELADNQRIAESISTLAEHPTKLHGVAVRTASAILCFYEPNKYPIVDVRSWKALYNEQLTQDRPTPKEYQKYVEDVKSIAVRCKMSMHEVDAALWVVGGGKP